MDGHKPAQETSFCGVLKHVYLTNFRLHHHYKKVVYSCHTHQ